MALPPPNYTQVPNILFDEALKQIDSMCTLKVILVVIRQTFGWHKREDNLSISRLQELTGLSRRGTINGIEDALVFGLITRRAKGQSFVYQLNVELVQDLHSFDPATSANFAPVLVHDLHPQKKGKEKKRDTPPPQVELFRRITQRYPKRQLYQSVVDAVGEAPDESLLARCWQEWLARGYNPQSIKWLTDWPNRGGPPSRDGVAASTESRDPSEPIPYPGWKKGRLCV